MKLNKKQQAVEKLNKEFFQSISSLFYSVSFCINQNFKALEVTMLYDEESPFCETEYFIIPSYEQVFDFEYVGLFLNDIQQKIIKEQMEKAYNNYKIEKLASDLDSKLEKKQITKIVKI